jgi:hypothetical protein
MVIKNSFIEVIFIWGSRDSAVGITTGHRLDGQRIGMQIPVGSRIFSMSSRLVLGPTQPPIQWVPGALSLGVKWPGHEADHSPPISVKVKKTLIYTYTPSYIFLTQSLIRSTGTASPSTLPYLSGVKTVDKCCTKEMVDK